MTRDVRGVLGARTVRPDSDAVDPRLAPTATPTLRPVHTPSPRPAPGPVPIPVPLPEPERRMGPRPAPEPERAPLQEAEALPTAAPPSHLQRAFADGGAFIRKRATAIGVSALAVAVAMALVASPMPVAAPSPAPLPVPQIPIGFSLPYPLQPAFEKPILEALAKGARIGWLKVRDYYVVDGDWVQVTGQGYGYVVHLNNAGTMIPIPIPSGQEAAIVNLRSLTDGGGGVTLEVSTATGIVPLPPAPVGASITVPVR